MSPITPAAVRKTARVRRSPEEAFALFTERIAEWWPVRTHSVGREGCEGVRFEAGVGGRIVESVAGGATAVWGTVLVWEPPARVRFTWHPGTPPDEATQVEVTFTGGADGTVVELVHTGWDRRPDGVEARRSYDSGWELVLGSYAAAGARGLEAERDDAQAG